MNSILSALAFSALLVTSGAMETTTKICPLLGPAFPFPTGLSSNNLFQGATKRVEAAINTSLATGMTTNNGPGPFNQTTFSIGMFNTAEKDLLYDFHYTDGSVRGSSTGTKSVNSDSVYRLGSIGKVLSVYIFLIQDGDLHWKEPITKYIPELAAAANVTASSYGVTARWNEITLGQLCSHMSGLPRDYGVSDISFPWSDHPGFPSIPEDQVPSCNYFLPMENNTFIPCTRDQYLAAIMTEPPVFQSASTPVYSNNAFVLLAIALENITGKDLGSMFNESLVYALHLPGTSFDVPSSDQNGVIPGDPTTSGWDSPFGPFAAAGAYFSSTNDMATIGKAIMNSTLLSKAQTRRWLKPVTFTSNVNTGVGSPWEIFRAEVNGRMVDLYCKNGGWGAYSTELVLVPDYEFGFVVLSASTINSDADPPVYLLSEIIGSEVLPVLEEVARDQANATFAGNYAASNLNSSLTITVDDQPGLRVTQWISNGTEVLDAIMPGGGPGTYVDFRLQPNQLYTGNQVGFTGIYERLPKPIYSGPMNVNCLSWPTVDGLIYGNIGIEEFVFEIDPATGKATGVSPKALRINLDKKE